MAHIETEARKLAHSGKYFNFRLVQQDLVQAGYLKAEQLFRNPWQQEEVDRICRQYFRHAA